VVTAGEREEIVRTEQKRIARSAERPVAHDYSPLDGSRGCACLSSAWQVPVKQLSRAAINHEHQARPAIIAAPKQHRSVAKLRCGFSARDTLAASRAHWKNGTLAHLSAHDLEDPLDGLLKVHRWSSQVKPSDPTRAGP